ncbi:MAG: aminoacetone oxidase family FAD-binding enzyme [Gammaproteobacteria bacterium]|nr:aminoacetone oxidase family FAD-binding enzyme [Gammaproteobacteria bacterium]
MTIACDVLVIGAGAAGLMCALGAGRRGRRVRVVERANRPGKKILMSGGGRCNFTNTGTTPANFLSANPHFCKSALARYTPADFIAMVDRHGIGWHEKEAGQLFCNDSSKRIVRMLLDECADAGVDVDCGCEVHGVVRDGDGFVVDTAHGRIAAESLVVATGGLSIPSLGGSGMGYALARQFGHGVLPTRAGLVPLVLTGVHAERLEGLSGVALEVEASGRGQSFRGAMLVTHRGLSGPAILQVSSYWDAGEPLAIDLLPGTDALAWLRAQREARPGGELRTVLAERMPRRFAQRLCEHWLGDGPLRRFDAPALARAAGALSAWPVVASGTEGYRTAEVTLGGVDTRGLSSSSMMSRSVPGLFFIGEVVDVTGWLGGYNFQWAWASGHAAGGVA